MTNDNPAAGVDRFALQFESMIPVPPATNYGEREHITMQVRNAPNGQRATRQVATAGVHHIDVQSFPEALHINLYSDKSAGWLFLRRALAKQLYEALGRALQEPERLKAVSDSLDAIENEYADEWDLVKTLDRIRVTLGLRVVAELDPDAPKGDGSPDYSFNHAR